MWNVHEVIIFEEDTPLELIKRIKPDIIVKGGDWKPEDIAGYGIAEIRLFPLVKLEGIKISSGKEGT